jgi:hypothetical protein
LASVLVIKTVANFTFIAHFNPLAFMKDLTTDSGTLATYSSKFSILHFTCTAGFTLLVVIFALGPQTIVQTSRSAHLVSAVIGFFLLGYSGFIYSGIAQNESEAEDRLFTSTFGTP